MKTAIGKPDRMTFDLDPGEGVAWPQMQEAAQLVHGFLDRAGAGRPSSRPAAARACTWWCRSRRQFDWDTVKDFSQAIVQHLARTIPQRFVAKSGAHQSGGQDLHRLPAQRLRRHHGVRLVGARPAGPGHFGAGRAGTSSTRLKGGDHWSVGTVHTRLDEGNSPWNDYEASRTGLAAAMKALGFSR